MEERVPQEFVDAALAAARERRTDVASVPVTAIAAAAGVSRSTLLRRLGGTRAALDEAVRAAGVDPGARTPVRERAVEAAARVIDERGLGALTMDAVADGAGCSLPGLHAVVEGRDGLLAAVFERYGPVRELERLAADPPEGLEETVRALHAALAEAFQRRPRVMPALLADTASRPDGPGSAMFHAGFPRLYAAFGTLLLPHVRGGRVRPLPLPLLIQQILGPVAVHLMLRPALEQRREADLPPVEEACGVFAETCLRAIAAPGHGPGAGGAGGTEQEQYEQ
ncbi:TetR/AcrR family transcriptional regulator [Nocardiopsis baichengensis]|uniref:TetR/AcrR family transcriptional regulator n=1 Tax=Nocardiopsis baichengensis TaxID=280240 RepID=UPI00034B1002|nr:TetR/AcrR family transcriptional regulator [Nocardiopsis baichengensis]